MPITSPLAKLIEVLVKVKNDADLFGGVLSESEAQTRLTLIDPFLLALGWDLSNPDCVRVELIHNQARIDYGLLGPDGHTRIVVEAKKLGTNLFHPVNSGIAIQYAVLHNVPHVILTDGIEWHFYDDLRPGFTNPTTFNLRTKPLHELALEFITRLDYMNFGYLATQPQPVQTQPEVQIINMPETVQPLPTNTEFITFDQLPNDLRHRTPPTRIRLPNGVLKNINTWGSVLFELACFVLENNPNLTIPLLDQANRTVRLLRLDEPTYSFRSTQYRGQTIYINLDYDSNNYIKNAKYILRFLPENLRPQQPALCFE